MRLSPSVTTRLTAAAAVVTMLSLTTACSDDPGDRPEITTQPGSITVADGDRASFSIGFAVNVRGPRVFTRYTVTWYRAPANGGQFEPVDTEPAAKVYIDDDPFFERFDVLAIDPVTMEDDGTRYFAELITYRDREDQNGDVEQEDPEPQRRTSAVATLTVLPKDDCSPTTPVTFSESAFLTTAWSVDAPYLTVDDLPDPIPDGQGTFGFEHVGDASDGFGRISITNVITETGRTVTWGFLFPDDDRATYDPAVHGAADCIDVQWSARRSPSTSRNAATTFALRQDGYVWMVYVDRPFVSGDGAWRTFAFAGLTPDDFFNGVQPWMVVGQPALPDFTQPMTFGYAQGASCGVADDGTTICPPPPAIASVDVDDWVVRVYPSE